MILFILGATGRTGKHIVTKALKKGHVVHALVRDQHKLEVNHPNLKIFEGSPLNPDDIRKALKGCKAAVSGLNISRKSDFPWSPLVSPPDLLSSSLKNLLAGMKAEGISRVMIMSAAGAGDSWNLMPWWFKGLINSSNIGITYRDHGVQEKLLEESGLDWTIVRPVGLNNDVDEKNLVVTFGRNPTPGFTISRLAVAEFIVNELVDNKYLFKKPILSQKKK
jgi:putative NADH-flavin reductase